MNFIKNYYQKKKETVKHMSNFFAFLCQFVYCVTISFRILYFLKLSVSEYLKS